LELIESCLQVEEYGCMLYPRS